MFHETPELYHSVVVPYMDSFPASRLEWVFNILDGKKEAERILYRRSDVLIPGFWTTAWRYYL
jgi:m7GpppX diphosphatase